MRKSDSQSLSLTVLFLALNISSGNTSGLLGFWDGDQEKEYLLPNGTFLETNSSQTRIHYEFGQLCKLKYRTDQLFCVSIRYRNTIFHQSAPRVFSLSYFLDININIFLKICE